MDTTRAAGRMTMDVGTCAPPPRRSLWFSARASAALVGALVVLVGAAGGRAAIAADAANGAQGGYLGSDLWFQRAREAAANRAAMQALGSRDGARGGCAKLPAGWATVEFTVNFPASYGGYPAWVNSASLVPAKQVQDYVSGASPATDYTRSARSKDRQTVQTSLCAPANQVYWLVVDSGRQRIAIAPVDLRDATGAFRLVLNAPPIEPPADTSDTSDTASPPPREPGATPSPGDREYVAPGSDGNWTAPGSGPGYIAPAVSPPPSAEAVATRCNPLIPRYAQKGCRE